MKKIPLTQGQFSLVDDEDFDMLSNFKWYFSKGRNTNYAIADNNRKLIRMHRLIMNPKKGFVIDHINGDGLDNRRENLRVCSYSQNSMNSILKKRNKSGVKGVFWSKYMKKWCAQISINYKGKHLGYFSDICDAEQARKSAEKIYFGEYSRDTSYVQGKM